jgi:hypothetical protein
VEAFGDTLTQLAEGVADVARESTKTYVGGLNAIVEQQRLAAHASQRWISGVMSAQSNFRQQLVGSYASTKAGLIRTAQQSATLGGQAAAAGTESRSNAPASATRKQGNAVTRTPRRATPRRSKPAATDAGRPGPAQWTSEAYEPLQKITSLRGQES